MHIVKHFVLMNMCAHDVYQLAAIQAELARMNEENEKLRGFLSQVSHDYKALQLHLATLMQQRSNNYSPPPQEVNVH